MNYIRFFETLSLADVEVVGGKNASLGQMFQDATSLGIRVPYGFALTAQAYRDYCVIYGIDQQLEELLRGLDHQDVAAVEDVSRGARALIEAHALPPLMAEQLKQAYARLSAYYHQNDADVAVRSSATAEDLPGASFAGQQETFLHITSPTALETACIKAFSSLYTPRAIVYRREKGFPDTSVALSVGVQKMVRSDRGSAGVAFTLDTESGARNVVTINAAYGLGEYVVQGIVTPDEYLVAKTPLAHGYAPIIRKVYGSRDRMLVYDEEGGTQEASFPASYHPAYVLSDTHILELARAGCALEAHYSQLYGADTPLDIEWGVDGDDHQLYILQTRPETIHAAHISSPVYRRYVLQETPPAPLCTGISIGAAVTHGRVVCITHADQAHQVAPGDIVVTPMTDPDWVPIMKRAAAIITDRGGRTCHAAIVSRELGIPALVGTQSATQVLQTGMTVTVDTSQGMTGYVYEGAIPFTVEETPVATSTDLPLMLNLAQPERAFELARLPVQGVGLMRLEFVMGSQIGIHPLACVNYAQLDPAIAHEIADRCIPYADPAQCFVETVARAIGVLATAFEGKRVIVRLSDFKTNEYRQMIGGSLYEPVEENPMLGARGAYRYLQSTFAPAFALECAALRMVQEQLGCTNITVMVPFVRTVDELAQVRALLEREGVIGDQRASLYMMVEVPTNILLLEKYAPYVEGFSMGSNDLTQLTLGVDRDSTVLSSTYTERDEAVRLFIAQALDKAHAAGKPIGICGQAPSDDFTFAQWLLEHGISTISLNPDSVLPFYQTYYTTRKGLIA